MNNFRYYSSFVIAFIASLGFSDENDIQLAFRINVNEKHIAFICRATNLSTAIRTVPEMLLVQSNYFETLYMQDRFRRLRNSTHNHFDDKHTVITIEPGETWRWISSSADLDMLYKSGIYDNNTGKAGKGSYTLNTWNLMGEKSNEKILLGFVGVDGNIHKPVVKKMGSGLEIKLGFVYDKKDPIDLCFLILNGMREAVTIENPLTRNSSIIATSPAINYTRELFIPDAVGEQVVVEAGKVGEWRLPWQTVMDLIPKEDLEKIKAGGGDLDLIWKVGEFQSDLLPLSLADLPPDPQEAANAGKDAPAFFVANNPDDYLESVPFKNGSYTIAFPPLRRKVFLGLRFLEGYRYYFRIHDVVDGTVISDIPDPERTRVEFDFSQIRHELETNKTESFMLLMQEGFPDFVLGEALPVAPTEPLIRSVVPGRYRLYLVLREKSKLDQIRLVADFSAEKKKNVQINLLQWLGEPENFGHFHRQMRLEWSLMNQPE